MQSVKKVLLLGSGGLRISQAGEFDYSGSQAIKALKEENIEVILVNPNIATVQTDQHMADRVYLQPLNEATVTKIIEKEKPDAILLGFGGQTALNLGLRLEESGVLAEHHVTVLGSSVDTIRNAEDRDLFKNKLNEIGVKTAKSIAVTNAEDALNAAESIGYPIMMRAGFSLGGLGSGVVHSKKELEKRVSEVFSVAHQILIEENLIGWSEFEYEIVRDSAANALTICNMENFDPMGIHTGESIVVSPSQSLNNQEYHFLREIAIKVAHHFNIIGECNIQYAFNLETGEYRVIEINPRLSRSSALASKATGYPLAFIAAKLALGYKLYELKNSITKKTCAFFEPALDYIVVKIPRWDTHKLKKAERRIGTEMKSVGEVMAIGRSFPEALQKAIGMLNIGASCLSDYPHPIDQLENEIEYATDRRIFALYRYLLQGGTVEKANTLSNIDPWFLHHLHAMAQTELTIKNQQLTPELLLKAKRQGFSDKAIANLTNHDETTIRQQRISLNITPVVKQIDTLAGEFNAKTNYLYLTYHGDRHDIRPSQTPATLILGSGPYSIGSSVEFDWCGVTTARTLKQLDERPIIINSNPETVSTDYDESDRLYFEQLTFERVQDIADFENHRGIIVAMGGQVANNLVNPLDKAGYSLLGTPAQSINQAENRELFSSLLNELTIDQPAWHAATSLNGAKAFAEDVGYPVLIRPSFVLSGAAMNVVFSEDEMEKYLKEASTVSPDHPVVLSQFIQEGKELEMDGVAMNGEIIIEAISEHIENAGVHSGDATIVLPPQKLYLETIRRTKKITRKIVKALNITGPFNIQFIAKNNQIQVIECNLRASRSFPFVSKVTNHNFIEIATKAIMGIRESGPFNTLDLDYVGVKSPQFSYSRLKGANPVPHVEMASTGEVACLGEDLNDAFFQSWQATEMSVPEKKIFLSIGGSRKPRLLEEITELHKLGWELYTTAGTHEFLLQNNIPSHCVNKVSEGGEPNATTLIKKRKISLIINLPQGTRSSTSSQVTDGFRLRRLAIDHNIPLVTNLQGAQLILQCLAELHDKEVYAKSWQEFMNN
ncbi:Carbamoyl-phosphate synthase large chain [Piscirickettsia salmonis]|uniref:carbamoyl-phosphate synthase (glutamine-hydrolyzing) large subunit n=1 Tax=Piscirickettsia salmonis TaxID=1238 RepID=UPI0012B9416C|nr:carbamoyl-phosphate synthase (glutamine-hydrolyzing) large subunit [Piscirickettsia salmonis]QGP51028.1 Carbamoyl-phosphate synthase large chain [Piscirickettsia salmonis]QGP55735.1 Carbamoyl-phosphate synthase large chain [Piscirickettsia salmonis]QGP58399.1 Carbamoyl-phosphate synthase large chain [Piscirickettsia salmonis]QGP65304.1 Carbamoyl-phosphate synthase large chain [Piscirickettsia salmonis]